MSHYDPTDIRSQERAKADTDLRNKLEEDREEYAYKQLMSYDWGRFLAWGILKRARMFQLSYDDNALRMAFKEGMRNEGLYTWKQIHTFCPELYPVMVREQTDDNRNADDGSRNDH